MLDVTNTEIKVHFEGWSSKFDEWIDVVEEPERVRHAATMSETQGRAPPSEAEQLRQAAEESFKDALLLRGMQLVEMDPDGNCMFHSVAHQVYGDPSLHEAVRDAVVEYMAKNANHFSLFVPDKPFEEYLNDIGKDCCWGDHLELQACAEIYDTPIEIISTERGNLEAEKISSVDPSTEPILSEVPPIRLSYHGGNHYNSLMVLSAPPPLGRRSSTLIRSARVLANGGVDHAEMLQAQEELAQARRAMDHSSHRRNSTPTAVNESFPIAEVIGHSRI